MLDHQNAMKAFDWNYFSNCSFLYFYMNLIIQKALFSVGGASIYLLLGISKRTGLRFIIFANLDLKCVESFSTISLKGVVVHT